MTSFDAKQRILARRKQFLAAAMGLAACTPSADSGERPTSPPVVVSVEKPHAEAGTVEADAGGPSEPPETEPMVCLSEAPEPKPTICLSFVPTP